ncbi:hypothetical protein DFH09DRAFT_1322643 [Mycena vulgaris]|nr:hypothetical protein DFH09DRAFT_1322643 [Mycena vulgaris]
MDLVLASPLDFKICVMLLFDNQARPLDLLSHSRLQIIIRRRQLDPKLILYRMCLPDLTRQDLIVKISLAHASKIQDHFRPTALRPSGSGLGAS